MCTQSTPTTCTAHKPEVTVVVPVYNNAGSLSSLHDRLVAALGSTDSTNEIIYVNDGSTDSSFDVLKEINTIA
jgi:undecaprenyl-phosphate 4-deoxy-4-formamido-L-arabinose transferase